MNWTVRAKDKHNNIIKLKIESLDKENLKNNLKMLDYYPLRIERDYSIFGKKRLSNRIIIDFLEEWTSLEKVNINTQYALTIIKDNTSHKKLKDVLSIILFDINSGKTIEEAFNNCKSYFPDLFITNIIIGYKKGDLLSNLEMIKDYYSESFKTKEQVKRSLTYPKIVILCGACAISGGVFQNSTKLNREFLEKYPIDLYIPGCPVHPLTFINSVLRFIKK